MSSKQFTIAITNPQVMSDIRSQVEAGQYKMPVITVEVGSDLKDHIQETLVVSIPFPVKVKYKSGMDTDSINIIEG